MIDEEYEATYDTYECMQEDFPQDKVSFTIEIDSIFGGGNGTLVEDVPGMYCIRGEIVGPYGSKLVKDNKFSPLVDVWVTEEFLVRLGLTIPDWNCPEGHTFCEGHKVKVIRDIACETLRVETMDMMWFICRECGTSFNMGYEWGS
jgi:hypothetical protein